jgi:putative nucleotidyltransferase with HDIG domain
VKSFFKHIVVIIEKKWYLFFFSLLLSILISALFWNYDWKKITTAFILIFGTNALLCEKTVDKNRFFRMHPRYYVTFYTILHISAFFSLALGSYLGYEYLSTFLGVSLITILFGRKAGQVSCIFFFFVFALAFPQHWISIFASLLAGYITAEMVRNVKRRIELSFVAFFITAVQLAFYCLIAFSGYEHIEIRNVWKVMLVPEISAVLVIGILPYIEWISRIYSNIGLLELGNLNHPLLKELNTLAPGTYFHSTSLANFAEIAAEKIGCNPILARVGSYFHDIGKIKKPDFFTENQNEENPHDDLKPGISHLVLSDHIKTGVDLSHKYRLPLLFEDMIIQHHGTRIQAFFYSKAKEQNPNANEADFRYKGPKPSFKEAGILMLADSCEAALKSITDPTVQKAKATIKKIILGIFEERELDNSGLSLADLENIEDAFFTAYVNQGKGRISYPENIEKKRSERSLT